MFKVKFHSNTSSRDAERSSNILACKNFKCLEEPLGVLHKITSEDPHKRNKVVNGRSTFFLLQIPTEAAVSLIGSILLIIGFSRTLHRPPSINVG